MTAYFMLPWNRCSFQGKYLNAVPPIKPKTLYLIITLKYHKLDIIKESRYAQVYKSIPLVSQ